MIVRAVMQRVSAGLAAHLILGRSPRNAGCRRQDHGRARHSDAGAGASFVVLHLAIVCSDLIILLIQVDWYISLGFTVVGTMPFTGPKHLDPQVHYTVTWFRCDDPENHV